MQKFKDILLVTDLDGTLLRDDKTISTENIDAVRYFKSEGGKFSFVTGRMPAMVISLAQKIDINMPFGCVNGGGVFNHITNKYEWFTSLNDEYIELVEFVDKNFPHIGIQMSTADKIYFSKYNDAMHDFQEESHIEDNFCLYQNVKKPIFKVIFTENDEIKMQELIKALTSHPKANLFGFIRSDKRLFELLPKNVHKGTVLNKIVELYNLDMNKTISVGDFDNDVELIKAAKLGVAVENASLSAKSVADLITVSNEEHAIAKIIDDLDKGIIIL